MKNKQLLISVLIPTYNRPEYLKECLDSILSQKGFQNFELEFIISDNSDNTLSEKLVIDYIKKYSKLIIKYNKNDENLGMVGNWNKLLDLKTGKYHIFLSDDDKFYNEFSLKKLYDSLILNNLNAIHGLTAFIDSTGNIIKSESKWGNNKTYIISFNEVLNGCVGGFGGVLFKNIEKIYYDKSIGLTADWDFEINYISKFGNYGIIPKYTFCYRSHDNKLSNFTEAMNESELRVIKKWKMGYIRYLKCKIHSNKIIYKYILVFIKPLLAIIRNYKKNLLSK